VQKGLTWDFTVADVHTQPTDYSGAVVGHVLHVGNGKINMGVFLAENPCNPEQMMAFAGPVSSFHTKVTSHFERLTDQDWESYFWQEHSFYPDRPDWIATYLLDHNGNTYPQGRTLKGVPYTGSGISHGTGQQLLDYLLLFPNPASREARLRFVLNASSAFLMEVYDASGRIITKYDPLILNAAEHHFSIQVETWPPGLYLLRIGIGGQQITKEFLVQ